MAVIIRSDIIKRWLDNQDAFASIKAITGNVVRSKEGRTTKRVEIEGAGFYTKLHEGVGWFEVFKNLLQLRLPIVGASNEWLAINRLHELGLDTMTAVAYGKKGFNPAAQKSFIITEELTDTLSLARLVEQWAEQPPTLAFKRSLIHKVADISRVLHGDGINHRDLYICHFLLDTSTGLDQHPEAAPRLFLVDLHRAQMREQVPHRWLVKDIASLYFSSLDIGISQKDIFRFLKSYYQLPLREILINKHAFLRAVEKRATSLYVRDFGRQPTLPCKA